jgi:large subunit ribosomal protein L13
MKTYIIDAGGKRLGRVASEAASLLMGKNTSVFARNIVPDVEVKIINASKLSLDESKRTQKSYLRYSGYPGGLKSEKLDNAIEKKGYGYVVKRAVHGMLPKNKLRAKMIRHLKLSE